MSDFPNFDQLLKWAKEDPEQLERFRQQQIDSIINSAPEENQRRLRGLQFQIDAQRKLHANSPMASCVKISQMMHDSFAELRIWLNDITGANDPLRERIHSYQAEDKGAAKVLPFPAG